MAGGNGSGSRDLRAMQRLAQQVVGLRPEVVNSDAAPGELAWLWAKDVADLGDGWRHRVWWDGDEDPVAWGWAMLPHRVTRSAGRVREADHARLIWQVHPEHPELLDEVLDWFEGVAPECEHRTTVRSGDAEAAGRLEGHGYLYADQDEDWMQLNSRDLHHVDEPALPEGYRFRTAAEVGPDAAVAAHRDAWHPSGHTRRDHDAVRAAEPYREDLHVLLEAPDGTLVSSAIIWLDEHNASAHFQPVGTHRDHRRQGFARALLLHGMAKAREEGAEHALVSCPGARDHGVEGLYRSVGFQELSRDLPHVKAAPAAAV